MKKIIGLAILIVVVVLVLVCLFLYVYVPKGQEWDIKYTNLQRINAEGNVRAEKAELTKHGLMTRTNFSTNGDSIEYTFDIINDGTIDAKLKFNPFNLKFDYYFKKHIKYSAKYLDGTDIKKGDIIKAGETKTIKVTIIYDNESGLASIDSQFYESELYLMFLQKRF